MTRPASIRRKRYLRLTRVLVLLSALSAAIYLKWLMFDAVPENHVLFVLLVSAEVFNLAQAAGFWYTVYSQEWPEPPMPDFATTHETIDVFITVCGEPPEIVEETVRAAMRIRHPRKTVWILDDGQSLEIEAVAAFNGARYLTRSDRTGAKAGNVNNALRRTTGDFVVILDADHSPRPEFLERTMGAFRDPAIGFVQTPQSYRNRHENRVAGGAHDQLMIFYGPILRGRNPRDAVFSCGTNVVFRRDAFDVVNGMPEDSITEDLRIALLLLREGYRSVYVPEVLAEGIGPVDVPGYFSQQSRWARGGLEILFKRRPFFSGMRPSTVIEYILSFMYWFTGWAYGIYLVLPMAYLMFGQRPVQVPNQYPVYFLPYLAITLVTMAYATEFRINFRAIWFTLGSFPVHIGAFLSAIFGKRAKFVVTAKSGAQRAVRPVAVHLLIIVILAFAIMVGLLREGFTPSATNNVAFALGHILILQGFARYALFPEKEPEPEPKRPGDLLPPEPVLATRYMPSWEVEGE
ncbi:MAG TPA: glycosyltransferase family 2 protein [Coriobacteriia bacterium]|nr:glycosyltransferase family 2 protein [Coriobacteriia bacterium]